MIEIKCLICGNLFIPRIERKRNLFCSRKCYWISMKGKDNGNFKSWYKSGGITWNTGKHIKLNNALDNWRKNGGMSWNKDKRGYILSEETRKKISKAGKRRVLEGRHNNYKGGITPINEKIRKSLEYKLWHEAVFTRDNWTCQKTGVRGGRLVTHHINNFADFPELRTSIENGITLSGRTHREFHKIYGRTNNTKEQLNEFLK